MYPFFIKSACKTEWEKLKESQNSTVVGGRRCLLQQIQNKARMVVERSVSKDGGGSIAKQCGSGGGRLLACGRCLFWCDTNTYFWWASCPHTYGSGAEMRGSWVGKISTVTLVAGSHRTEADVCPWAFAFCWASKNTNSVNFFENCWHWCIMVCF